MPSEVAYATVTVWPLGLSRLTTKSAVPPSTPLAASSPMVGGGSSLSRMDPVPLAVPGTAPSGSDSTSSNVSSDSCRSSSSTATRTVFAVSPTANVSASRASA